MADTYPINAVTTAVAQVDTFTPATVEIDDIFTLTVTGDDGITNAVNFTATAATAANVAAGLVAAWNASTHRLCTPITASGSSTVVLTADTAGRPFSVAATTTDGGGNNTQTLTKASTTASAGPEDWGLAGNWFTNAVPVDGDNVVIDARATDDLLYSMNQSSVDLTTLDVYMSYVNQLGDTTNPLRISATTCQIGLPVGDGSSPSGPTFVNLDFGSVNNTTKVYNGRKTGINGLLPINLKGSHSANILHVYGGVVGVATARPGDTATFVTVKVDGGKCVLSSGVTTSTVTQIGGELVQGCACTTLTQDAGTLETNGSGAITTATINGTAYLESSGTITTLEVRSSGNVDMTGSKVARTVTTLQMHKGSTLAYDPAVVTITNPIQLLDCTLQDVTIKVPPGRTVVVA